MAKTAVAKTDDAPKSVALPDEMLEMYAEHAGEGTSQSRDDNLTPFVAILQTNSPQVNKRDPKYVEGAEPGDIMLAGLNTIWSGERGILFLPCAVDREWVEWKLRDQGGGFVGRHRDRPAEARDDKLADGRPAVLMPSGTQLVDTRYHFGLILNPQEAKTPADGIMPSVISLSSTGHTFSRQWMTQMNQHRLPGGRGVAPSYARLYRLVTVQKSNPSGTWFGFSVRDEGWNTNKELFGMGAALAASVREGAVQAAQPDSAAAASSAAGVEVDDNIPF